VSSGAPPEATRVFFTDRHIGHKVAAELRAQGEAVVRHDDVFPQDAPDEAWLLRVGREGWVAITCDTRIRRHPAERRALVESGALVFVVTARRLTGQQMAELIGAALPAMRMIAATATRPAIYTLGSNGKPTLLGIE
jgi:hypothetical protein